MNLTAQITKLREDTQGATRAERARLSCELAKRFEKIGEYEGAAEAIMEFWPNRGEAPILDGLDEANKAEVLLRVGAVTGRVGSADQIGGSQETAKNLITQSLELFERLGHTKSAIEAQGELGLCYWREGGYDE